MPGERLQLRPDLRVARRQVLLDVGDRSAPLLGERRLCRVHRPLALENTAGESLQGLQQQLVDRAEVVMNEAMVLPGLPGQLSGRDPRRSLSDQEPLRGVKERRDVDLPDRTVACNSA